jgi:hypothetical protein
LIQFPKYPRGNNLWVGRHRGVNGIPPLII